MTDIRKQFEDMGAEQRQLAFERMKFKVQAAVHALGPDLVSAAFAIEPYLNEKLREVVNDSYGMYGVCIARCASCPVAMFLSDKSNLNIWVDGQRAFAMPQRLNSGFDHSWEDLTAVRLPAFVTRLISRIDQMDAVTPLRFSLADLKVGLGVPEAL